MRPTPLSPRSVKPRWLLLLAVCLLAQLLALVPGATAQSGRHPDVDRLYCAYFLREPDAGGQAYWYEQRDNDASLVWIAEFFSQSNEFQETYGQQVSTGDFVRLIYRNLFDRTPDAGGFDYWVDRLDRGELQRGSVMAYFSESPEFIERIATVGCGNTGPTPGGNGDPAVAQRMNTFTDWVTPTKVTSDSRSLSTLTGPPMVADDTRTVTQCRPQGLPLISRTFDQFPAFAFEGPTLPGLIVEGRGIPNGDLSVVPLGRSPITLVSDADSANNVHSVTNPTTSTVQSAVTALKRDADARLTGLDVVASDINYSRQETYSYEESTLNVGVSLHYESATLEAGFENDFKQRDAVERHSISVRMVQPMFTIRMERDGFASPEDYLAAGVTAEEIDRLEAQGQLGVDNPPLVIESVTYGRIMAFTMTSETAESASELMTAVNGAYGGLSGEANLTNRQLSLLSSSSTQMMAYGGDQGLALSAIANGDLSQFFGPANTTTAAPLTMTLRTLDGEIVDVADEASLKRIACTEQFRPYQYLLKVSGLRVGTTWVYVNGNQVARRDASDGPVSGPNHVEHIVLDSLLKPGTNTVEFAFDSNGDCVNPFGEVERMNASISRRGGPGEAWTLKWADGFDKVVCFTSWEIDINPINGQVNERL